MTTVIVWFRNDLRVADNPALHHALAAGAQVIPLYIHAPDEQAPWPPGAASRWWLHHSLIALNETIVRLGSRLIVRRGPTLATLHSLIRQTDASQLYCNRTYEPVTECRDRDILRELAAAGVRCTQYNASLLHEPGSVLNKDGHPYKVFTPFWRACQWHADATMPLSSPSAMPLPPRTIESSAIVDLGLVPDQQWHAGLQANWRPGEIGAHQRLQAYCQSALAHYPQWRDFPDRPGTTRLSPYLHFGEISARQAVWTLQDYSQRAEGPGLLQATEALIRQLGWREFAHHVLQHFPHTSEEPLNPRFRNLPWNRNDALLRAWQRGRTGIPIVDAGMRQLWQTGWMHNRVRMITASFLVKNCRIHWQQGARWFWDTLTDANLANNSLNWQWITGCGADAAPFHRIFNPVLQGQKFDAEGRYVRRWVPKLANLPSRWIHQPWLAPATALATAKIRLGEDYPAPAVDLAASRLQALSFFRESSGQ